MNKKGIKKYIEDNKFLTLIIGIIIIIFVIYLVYFSDDTWNFIANHWIYSTKDEHIHVDALIAFHNIMIVLLTILLVLVAAIQLGDISKTGQADFLFCLAQQYGSSEIIKARQIIQLLYRKSKIKNKKACECIHREVISTAIDNMSKKIKSSSEYILLLNLLDYLEDISYYGYKNNIEPKDIEDLMGPSIEFYYQIFEKRIKERRKKYLNEMYYCYFEKLAKNCRKERMKKYNDEKYYRSCQFKCCKCGCDDCKQCACKVFSQ